MADTRLAALVDVANVPGSIQRGQQNVLANQLRREQVADIPLSRADTERARGIQQQQADTQTANIQRQIQETLLKATDAEREEGIRTANSLLQVESQQDLDLFRAANPVDSAELSPVFDSQEFAGARRIAEMTIQASQPVKAPSPLTAIAKINDDLAAGRITEEQAAALRAKATAVTKGTQFTLTPEGGVTFSQGGVVGDEQITPGAPTINKIDQEIIANQGRLDRVDVIIGGFDPKFFEIGNRISAKLSELKEKFNLGTLGEEERRELEEISLFRRDAIALFNKELKEASGAAVTPSEAERMKGQLPNAGTGLFDGDSATVFSSKMKGAVRDLKRSQARLFHARTKGINFADIPLGNIDAIIDRRGQELLDLGLSDEAVKIRLKREFGI